MSGLLAAGRQMRRTAQDALTQYVQNETSLNLQDEAIERQEEAAEMQLYGTGAGIGGSIGVNKALAAKGTEAAGGGFVSPTGGLGAMSKGANAGAVKSMAPRVAPNNVGGIFSPDGGLAQGANSGSVLGGQLAADGSVVGGKVIGQEAVKTGATEVTKVAASKGAEAAVGSQAAGGASGLMSTISTIATPLAIGLGAAFLINKLFG